MTTADPRTADREANNRRSFRRLVLAMQASLNQLNLLIGICDNPDYRSELIQQYEAELQAQGVTFYRVELVREKVSLRQALEELGHREAVMQSGQAAVVTVLGADRLLSVRLQQAQSDRERFFFSLQWTREALREFQFPIVLWLTEKIAAELTIQAPDFWSWRGGVFEFEQPLEISAPSERVSIEEMTETDARAAPTNLDPLKIQILELRLQIAQLEDQDPESPLLPSLYSRLGKIYRDRLDQGTFADYPQEQHQAVEAFQKAIALQEKLNLQTELSNSLNELALLYKSQGRYNEAEPLYLRALAIDKQQLGANHPAVAISLNNLANLYESQGRYREAEPLYLRALEISEQQLGANHPTVATQFNNLAELYRSQGRYREAEPLYLRALSIGEQQLGADHPDVATSLNNLASLYRSQGRTSEAEPLYLRALEISEQQLGADHPDVATRLNNLAYLYDSQGRYRDAELLYLKALEIREQRLGMDHPDTIITRQHLERLRREQPS